MEKEYPLFEEEENNIFNDPKTGYKTAIPPILTDICDYLIKLNVKLSKQFADGRINASMNEAELLKEIKEQFGIQEPRSRAWFDFSIENESGFFPVNIKITDTTHADNLNCKLGIYYALTGLLPHFPNETRWLTYFEHLKENLGKEKNKDYYFLIFNKQNPTDIFVNSLKGLQDLQPNGNNLPFQCKWDNNRKYQNRSFNKAAEFILSTFGHSIKLRSEIYFNFKKYFPEYV